MPSGGWQTSCSGWLQHISASTLNALSWLPGWAVIAILAGTFAILIGRAVRRASTPPPGGDGTDVDVTASTQENSNDKVSPEDKPAGGTRCRNGQAAVAAAASASRSRRSGPMITAAMAVTVALVAVVVLYLVFRSAPGATHSAGTGSVLPACRGRPEGGTAAPAFTLTSGAGKPVSLSTTTAARCCCISRRACRVSRAGTRSATWNTTRPHCGPTVWTRSSPSPPTAPI